MTLRVRHLALLALAALLVRLPVLAVSPGASFDLESYARAAACGGPGLYSSPALAGRYPYLPLWWMILKALAALQRVFGGDVSVWFRLPGVAADLAVCSLAYLMARRRRAAVGSDEGQSARAGIAAGLAWALNPLAVLISAGHGQFDSLALALLLGAAWLLEYSADGRSETWAALCLAAAVALKTWPLVFLPLCLGALSGPRERIRFTALALLPPLALLSPWLAWDGVRAVAGRLAYSGVNALGITGVLHACFYAAGAGVPWRQSEPWIRALALILLGSALAWALMRARGLRLLEGLPWVALILVLLAPGLSPQYLIWAPALALAFSPALAWRLSLAALPLALGFYALFMPEVLAGRAAWAPPEQTHALILAWGAANLVWWLWTAGEWRRLSFGRPRGSGVGLL